MFAPIVAVGGLTFLLLMAALIVEQAGLSSDISDAQTLALFASIACLPFAFLVGLLRSRFSEADAISELLAQLGEGGGRGALRDALADALGDPTLELAYWVPDQDAYVDADGQPVRVDPRRRARSPPSSSTRANESLRSCTARASRRNANWYRQRAPLPG